MNVPLTVNSALSVNGPATRAFSPLAIVVSVVKLLGFTLMFAAPPRLIVEDSLLASTDPSVGVTVLPTSPRASM